MIERTELREAFFAETRNDPFAHMIANLCARMWAEGYEQALRDNSLHEERAKKSHSERVEEAYAYITDRKREEQARAIIAFAQIGYKLTYSYLEAE